MATTKKQARCKGITAISNKQCQMPSGKNSDYCYQHDPDKPARKKKEDGVELKSEVHPGSLETLEVDIISPQEMDVAVDRATQVAVAADPTFAKFEVAKRIAHVLALSSLVPDAYRGRPNDCFVAINMGASLGMDPFQAIQSIAVIEGKPCLYGDGLIGVVRASPKCEWIKETISDDGNSATCVTQRKGDPDTISATYTMDDAVQAGIHTKFNWKKHPKRMLQMRARAYCLRDAYPDLLKGLGVVEEHQDHEDTPPPVTSYNIPEPEPQKSLDIPAPTLKEVEHAMMQSDTMEQLLKAADMAKQLEGNDQKTARVTYKKMKTAIMDTGEA